MIIWPIKIIEVGFKKLKNIQILNFSDIKHNVILREILL
jgi:hypothetical protein